MNNVAPEADELLQGLLSVPSGSSIDSVYTSCIRRENELRRLWATDRDNPRLSHSYVGLIKLFEAPAQLRQIRHCKGDSASKIVMALPEEARRPEGSPSMVEKMKHFTRNWSLFTEGSLSQMLPDDWKGVVIAGGAIEASLTHFEETVSDSDIRRIFHKERNPNSDIDAYLCGLTEEEGLHQMIRIYEAVRRAVPVEVACVLTQHTMTIHSQFPYRPIQIIRRIYSSPAEILASFDIDCVACLYSQDGVYASPRALLARMRQLNVVDISRLSPTYELRLSKYSDPRGYAVYVPSLDRERVDSLIYTKTVAKSQGLMRLLLLAKSKLDARHEAEHPTQSRSIGGQSTGFHPQIPYGAGWTARRIKDSFPDMTIGNRLNHEDLAMGDKQARARREAQRDIAFIRNRIRFQIVDGEAHRSVLDDPNAAINAWSADVYVNDNRQFFAAIAAHDLDMVNRVIKYSGFNINQLDEEGRTGLHLAIMIKAEDIAIKLIEEGINLTSCTPGGRNALHLAAHVNLPKVVDSVAARSRKNRESTARRPIAGPSTLSGPANPTTDCIDIEHCDSDSGITPLTQAFVSDSIESVRALLRAGASLDRVRFGEDTQLYLVPASCVDTLRVDRSSPMDLSSKDSVAVVNLQRWKGFLFPAGTREARL